MKYFLCILSKWDNNYDIIDDNIDEKMIILLLCRPSYHIVSPFRSADISQNGCHCFSYFIWWVDERTRFLIQYSCYRSSISVAIPVFLLQFHYSCYRSSTTVSIPVFHFSTIPVFLLQFQYSCYNSSIDVTVTEFLLMFQYSCYYSSIPATIIVFLLLF